MSKDIKQLNEELEAFLEAEYNEDLKMPMVEMVDVSKARTNLPVIVWVDGPRNVPHADRIKFANDYSDKLKGVELIPMTIDNPHVPEKLKHKVKIKNKDVDKVGEWITLNAKLIQEYMNGNISTDVFLDSIQKV